MEPIALAILTINLLAIIGLTILTLRRASRSTGPSTEITQLQQTVQQLSTQQSQQLQQTINLVLQQLNRHQESNERSSQMVHTRLDHTSKLFADVQGKLLQMEEANKRLFEIGKDISGLQSILKAPKLRGTVGEIWLQDLIGQMVPKAHFQMQYRFKSGETCDAVITLRDGLLLPIDSKFSLENFVKMLEAEGEGAEPFRKLFVSDTKKRIDEIAGKYILPHEGTLDCAFMYVPAENVYYQAFIQDEGMGLLSYAFQKRIIPVSPSSFYAYIQVILFGLRGMEIEQSARAIQKNLSGLYGQLEHFRTDYTKIGTHLKNAQSSYEQADKRLLGVETKFGQLATAEEHLIEGGIEVGKEAGGGVSH